MNVQFRWILKDESYFASEQHLLEMEALCAALNNTTRISSPDPGSSDRWLLQGEWRFHTCAQQPRIDRGRPREPWRRTPRDPCRRILSRGWAARRWSCGSSPWRSPPWQPRRRRWIEVDAAESDLLTGGEVTEGHSDEVVVGHHQVVAGHAVALAPRLYLLLTVEVKEISLSKFMWLYTYHRWLRGCKKNLNIQCLKDAAWHLVCWGISPYYLLQSFFSREEKKN